MQSLRLHPDSTVYYETSPIPVPNSTQLVIRVSATAITRSELTWSETLSRPLAIPGHDVSGTVVQAPPSSKFKVDDAVSGLLAFNRDGAAAEYTLAIEEELCHKPKNLSHEQAAAIPLSALTAWQALFEHGGLTSETRLLITAASGGVGSSAVQIAKSKGAYVIGICSAENIDFVKQLGADVVLDYKSDAFMSWVKESEDDRPGKGVDMILDCISGETLKKCLATVRERGTVVSIADPTYKDWVEVQMRGNEEIKTEFFVVRPDGTMLENIRELIEEGALKEVVDKVLPLSQGREAFEILEKGHVRGKLVLQVEDQK